MAYVWRAKIGGCCYCSEVFGVLSLSQLAAHISVVTWVYDLQRAIIQLVHAPDLCAEVTCNDLGSVSYATDPTKMAAWADAHLLLCCLRH